MPPSCPHHRLALLALLLPSLLASPGSFLPVEPGGDRSSQLLGVPLELRDKILAFHRQLETPDNFTAPSPPSLPPLPPPSAPRVAGLAEWSKEDEAKRRQEEAMVTGELQSDLFRFSSKVSTPHVRHFGLKPTSYPSKQNFISFLKRQARLRERIKKEWKRFIKWRVQKRKRKRLKRRINRRLNTKLRKKFGSINLKGKNTKEEIIAFRKRKKQLKRRIAKRLRSTLRLKKLQKKKSRLGKERSLKEEEEQVEQEQGGKRTKKLRSRKLRRRLRPPRKRHSRKKISQNRS